MLKLKGFWRKTAALAGLLVLGATLYVTFARQTLAVTEKQVIQQRYEDQKRVARQPKPGAAEARPAFAPDGPWPTGIFEEGQAPFPASAVTVSNQWQGRLNGDYVRVYAGSLPNDPAQGVVIVSVVSADQEPVSTEWLKTPEKVGALRVVAAHHTQLTLESTTGLSFTFDVQTRSLVPAKSK